MNENQRASPEVKKLIDKLAPDDSPMSSQGKYEAIIRRKLYDHHCFLECVRMRLDSHRGTHATCATQEDADKTFTHMLLHSS